MPHIQPLTTKKTDEDIMRFKAIFFDRDNTLTYYNPDKARWQGETVSSWSGKPFEL